MILFQNTPILHMQHIWKKFKFHQKKKKEKYMLKNLAT